MYNIPISWLSSFIPVHNVYDILPYEKAMIATGSTSNMTSRNTVYARCNTSLSQISLQPWLPRGKGIYRVYIATGILMMKAAIQQTIIVLYECFNVCHCLECNGRQIAKKRSREMATRVKQLTLTETAENRQNKTN